MADLLNEFSWSRTRDNVFQECRRRYYLHYYGAWGGWDAAADPGARTLYVLKQLGTRQMWAGRLVHEAVERSLLALRHGHALSEASLIEDTVRQMREEWKGSRDRRVPREPEAHRALRARVRRARSRTASGRRSATTSSAACATSIVCRCSRRSSARPPSAGSCIEDIGSFTWEGTRVFTAPDFGYWNQADRLQLVDWKTGGNGDGASLQLGGYALYALEVLRVDLPRVDLLEVNLREGKVHEPSVGRGRASTASASTSASRCAR